MRPIRLRRLAATRQSLGLGASWPQFGYGLAMRPFVARGPRGPDPPASLTLACRRAVRRLRCGL